MTKAFLIFSALIAAFGCAVLAVNPALAEELYDEGHLFENLTVVISAAALLFSIPCFFARLRMKSGYGFWLFLFFLILVFIGDELSWGMFYFGIEKPRIAGVGFDGLHDVLSISVGVVKHVRDYMRSVGFFDIRSILIMLGLGFGIAALSYFLIKQVIKERERIYRFFSKNLKWKPFFFFFFGITLLAIAMVIDDDNLVGFPHKRIVEESLEVIAAAAFLFAPLSGLKEKRLCMT